MIHMIVSKIPVEIVSLILESPTLAVSTRDPGITWSVKRSVPQNSGSEFRHDLYSMRHGISDQDDPNCEVMRIFS